MPNDNDPINIQDLPDSPGPVSDASPLDISSLPDASTLPATEEEKARARLVQQRSDELRNINTQDILRSAAASSEQFANPFPTSWDKAQAVYEGAARGVLPATGGFVAAGGALGATGRLLGRIPNPFVKLLSQALVAGGAGVGGSFGTSAVQDAINPLDERQRELASNPETAPYFMGGAYLPGAVSMGYGLGNIRGLAEGARALRAGAPMPAAATEGAVNIGTNIPIALGANVVANQGELSGPQALGDVVLGTFGMRPNIVGRVPFNTGYALGGAASNIPGNVAGFAQRTRQQSTTTRGQAVDPEIIPDSPAQVLQRPNGVPESFWNSLTPDGKVRFLREFEAAQRSAETTAPAPESAPAQEVTPPAVSEPAPAPLVRPPTVKPQDWDGMDDETKRMIIAELEDGPYVPPSARAPAPATTPTQPPLAETPAPQADAGGPYVPPIIEAARRAAEAARAAQASKPVDPQVPQPAETTAPTTAPEARLPRDLAGAKPRFGYGKKNVELTFESDLDRAAYIVSQANKNKRHDDYLAWATKAFGMTEEQLAAHGQRVRAAAKAAAKDAEGTTALIGRVDRGAAQAPRPAPPAETPPQPAPAPLPAAQVPAPVAPKPAVAPASQRPAPVGSNEDIPLTRLGDQDEGGNYYGIEGQTQYEGGERFVLPKGSKVADLREAGTADDVINEALNDPNLTPEQRATLEESRGQGDIDYTIFDETPMADAARRLGYDAVRVVENQDMPGTASSVFVLNNKALRSAPKPITAPRVQQTEIPGAQEGFNLASEEVSAPAQPKPVDTTADALPGTQEPAYVSEARRDLATLESQGKGETAKAKAIRNVIDEYVEKKNNPNIDYRGGDKIEFNGKTQKIHGGTFYEYVYLSGPKKGQIGVTQTPPRNNQTKPTPAEDQLARLEEAGKGEGEQAGRLRKTIEGLRQDIAERKANIRIKTDGEDDRPIGGKLTEITDDSQINELKPEDVAPGGKEDSSDMDWPDPGERSMGQVDAAGNRMRPGTMWKVEPPVEVGGQALPVGSRDLPATPEKPATAESTTVKPAEGGANESDGLRFARGRKAKAEKRLDELLKSGSGEDDPRVQTARKNIEGWNKRIKAEEKKQRDASKPRDIDAEIDVKREQIRKKEYQVVRADEIAEIKEDQDPSSGAARLADGLSRKRHRELNRLKKELADLESEAKKGPDRSTREPDSDLEPIDVQRARRYIEKQEAAKKIQSRSKLLNAKAIVEQYEAERIARDPENDLSPDDLRDISDDTLADVAEGIHNKKDNEIPITEAEEKVLQRYEKELERRFEDQAVKYGEEEGSTDEQVVLEQGLRAINKGGRYLPTLPKQYKAEQIAGLRENAPRNFRRLFRRPPGIKIVKNPTIDQIKQARDKAWGMVEDFAESAGQGTTKYDIATVNSDEVASAFVQELWNVGRLGPQKGSVPRLYKSVADDIAESGRGRDIEDIPDPDEAIPDVDVDPETGAIIRTEADSDLSADTSGNRKPESLGGRAALATAAVPDLINITDLIQGAATGVLASDKVIPWMNPIAVNLHQVAEGRDIGNLFAGQGQRFVDSKAMREVAEMFLVRDGNRPDGVQETYFAERDAGRRIFKGKLTQAFDPIASQMGSMNLQQRQELDLRLARMLSGESPIDPSTPEGKVAQSIKKLADEAHDYATEAGLQIGYAKDYGMPHSINAAAVDKDQAGFLDAATRAYALNNPKRIAALNTRLAAAKTPKEQAAIQAEIDALSNAKPREQAEAWLDNIINGAEGADRTMGLLLDSSPATNTADFAKERIFLPQARAILRDYYNNNPVQAWMGYIDRVTTMAEFARRFGPRGEKWIKMVDKMRKEGASEVQITIFKNQVKDALGTLNPRVSDGHALANAMLGASNMAKLKTTALANVLESMAPATRGQFLAAITGPLKMAMNAAELVGEMSPENQARFREELGRLASEPGGDIALARAAGIIDAAGTSEIMANSAYSVDEATEYSGGGGARTAARVVNSGTQGLARAYGIELSETAKRATTASLAANRITSFVDGFLDDGILGRAHANVFGRSANNPFSIKAECMARLRRAGVADADMVAFAKAWRQHAAAGDLAAWMASDDPMAPMARKVLRLENSQSSVDSNRAFGTGGKEGSLISQDHLFGKVVMTFMRYPAAALQQIFRPMAADVRAGKEGIANGVPISDWSRFRMMAQVMGLPMMAAASMAFLYLRDFINGYNDKTWAQRMIEGFSYTGATGAKAEQVNKFARGESPPFANESLQLMKDINRAERGQGQRVLVNNAIKFTAQPAVQAGLAIAMPAPFNVVLVRLAGTKAAREEVVEEVMGPKGGAAKDNRGSGKR